MGRNHNWYQRNARDKRLLQKIICQQTGQPRRDGKIPRNLQPTKNESWREKFQADE